MEFYHNTPKTITFDNSSLKDYIELLKPRVMGLVVFTAYCGYLLSPFSIHPFLAFVGILSIALGAGASGCLNQWYESKTDALMSRTKNRPIPSGRVSKESALRFGMVLAFTSVLLLQIAFSALQSLSLLFTIFYYSFFYSVILKPYTVQNIVIGGASGAFPPVIGYSLGGTIDTYAFFLFLIIFLWTPMHFWSLAFGIKDDYKASGLPILHNAKGDQYTKRRIFYYTIMTILSTFIPLLLRPSSILAWFSFFILNSILFYFAVELQKNTKKYKDLFLFSMIYLFFIFLFLVFFHT